MLKKNKKKIADILRSKQANDHRDLQIIPKLLSSRQHEQRALNNSHRKSSGHAKDVGLAELCMEMIDGGKWQRQLYFNFIFRIVAQFLVW